MFDVNKKIEKYYNYEGKERYFEPDSSPVAYEYYKLIYPADGYLKKNFDFSKPVFSLYSKDSRREDGFNYKNAATTCNNRLFVLLKGTESKLINNVEHFRSNYKLGGECDFNFNDIKCKLFKEIIENDLTASDCEKKKAQKKLKECHQKHHTLLNFSVMQVVGNLQGFKGSNRFDRLDTFISELNKYYLGISSSVLQSATPSNKGMLKKFLDEFNDIYQYCEAFYLIEDKTFVDRIIEKGDEPISNVNELLRYMALAEEYWSVKENRIV